jgi:rRNA maturation protein Nop10
MLHRCDKCGATTRWYDEKCPSCGAAQAVETPTAPIALPRFAPSSRRDEKALDALASRSNETPATKETAPQEPKREQKTPDAPKIVQEEPKRQEKTSATQENTPAPDDEPTETPPRPERSQRLEAFWRAVDAWRSTFASETASVTIPRGRAARYALAVLFELVVCPPCAILAAYFFTRALFADRRADYHGALVETEKTRRTLAVGLGVFAAFLCAFIFYVQSQEVALPMESGPTSQLFRK